MFILFFVSHFVLELQGKSKREIDLEEYINDCGEM